MSFPHSTALPSVKQCQTYPRDYICSPIDQSKTLTCPFAQTLDAFWAERNSRVVFGMPCKRWGCSWCARSKIKALAGRTQTADPKRLLTLTIDPSLYSSPREAFDKTRRQVPELIRQLREKFGEVEYLKVTELHKSGFPHYHLMIRSGYLPHECIKSIWSSLTGAKICHIEPINQKFSTFFYLVKYLSKMHRIAWTDRHVSYSRNYFRPDPNFEKEPCTLTEKRLEPQHPWIYLHNLWSRLSVRQIREFAWLVPDQIPGNPELVDPKLYGLPRERDPEWWELHWKEFPPRKNQTSFPKPDSD